MKHSKAQRMMIDDGLPASVIIAQSKRDEAWLKNPPRPMPAFNAPHKEEGADTKAFRAALEAAQARNSVSLSSTRSKRPEGVPKPSREGLTSVGDIATSLKVHPRIARAALRAAKVPKPDVGWAFATVDVARITKIIKDAIECDTSSSEKKSPAKSTKLKGASPTPASSSKKVASKKSIKPAKKSAKPSKSSKGGKRK